ncbi:phage protein [Lacticaseibacillus casei A2-362]|nr:phage protein [Lacticaseibacillus casei A2-362]
MSNETKRDVFEKLAECYAEVCDAYTDETGSPYYCDDEPNYLDEYDAALPDNLPVVSKEVSNTMITYRFIWWKEFLDKAYDNELSGDEDINYKVRSESAEVVRAWVLGVWRVEETGEIVKLEEEK